MEESGRKDREGKDWSRLCASEESAGRWYGEHLLLAMLVAV